MIDPLSAGLVDLEQAVARLATDISDQEVDEEQRRQKNDAATLSPAGLYWVKREMAIARLYAAFCGGSLIAAKIKRRLDAAILALARGERGADAVVPEWRLHDLRRTCATGMAELGIAPHIIEVMLNHISGYKAGVAGIYNRAEYPAERKAALERWAAHVRTVATGASAKVLALKGAR
jgi:integrase